MAHHTQFATPGWAYLSPSSSGMGALPGGGSYVTMFNPRNPAALEASIVVQTSQATRAQNVTFRLAGAGDRRRLPSVLHVWRTTAAAYFAQLPDVSVAPDGSFSLVLAADAVYSITTTTGQGAASPAHPIPTPSPFPFPYSDTFDALPDGAYARYFCDEGGVFVAATPPPALAPGSGGMSFAQVSADVARRWRGGGAESTRRDTAYGRGVRVQSSVR